jgi:hypothetical protein
VRKKRVSADRHREQRGNSEAFARSRLRDIAFNVASQYFTSITFHSPLSYDEEARPSQRRLNQRLHIASRALFHPSAEDGLDEHAFD